MNSSAWQFDILRQSGWDLWVGVCLLAVFAQVFYAVAGKLWRNRQGQLGLMLTLISVVGSAWVLLNPAWRTPTVGLFWTFFVLALLSATVYLNLKSQLGGLHAGLLLGLRLTALGLLVPMLFEPVIRFVSRPKPQKPLVVLVDTSASMSVPDVQNGPTRLQSVWQALRPRLAELQAHFVPSYGVFSNSEKAIGKPEELATMVADGPSTDLVGALRAVLTQQTRSDAAVLLISDGIDNTSANVLEAVRGTQRPIHTVWVGSQQTEPATLANIAVENVEATEDLIVGRPSNLRITVRSTALANRLVEVKMAAIDAAGKTTGAISTQKLVLQPLAEGQTVDMSYQAAAAGIQRLAVWVDPIPGERSTVDNRQEFQGLALDPRIKVLYLEGRARPEYRDLNRALARDSNIELASLLRIQNERFAAAGTVDGHPIAQIPATGDEWNKFDVIILGDLDSQFLSSDQQQQIERAVAEGKGLLMIGGQNSFGPGGYGDTPVERALPVFAGTRQAAQEKTPLVPQLTSEGLTHPAMEGMEEWFGGPGKPPSKQLPPLLGYVVVPKAKSGAAVLLRDAAKAGGGQGPIILAVQNYGKGRSAAFTADTTYRWYLPLRGMGQDSPYNRFWGQLVRWLGGADVRNRQRGAGLEALLNKNRYRLGENVVVRAMVRDERGDATRYAQVQLLLRPAGGAEPKQIPLQPVEAHSGMYQAIIEHPEKGDWTMELTANREGKELGRQPLAFTVIPPADEMLKLAANPQLLSEISQASGGFHYSLSQLPQLIEQLIRTDTASAQARQQSVPLANLFRVIPSLFGHVPHWEQRYDLPMQGALALLILAGEWILRRKWQLP